jgi:hypothetical protein
MEIGAWLTITGDPKLLVGADSKIATKTAAKNIPNPLAFIYSTGALRPIYLNTILKTG